MGEVEVVHLFADGPMSTGVSIPHTGRIIVNFLTWGDDVRAALGRPLRPTCRLGR